MINPLKVLLANHSLWKPSQNTELIIKDLCLDKMHVHFPSGSKIMATLYVKKEQIKISEENL